MRSKTTFRIALTAAVLSFSSLALAEPTPAEREQARTYMEEGDKRRDVGDMKGALERFKAADAIVNVPTTALEVARAQASLGLLVEARDTLARIAKMAAKPTDPPQFAAARKTAESMTGEITARIPSLQIAVSGGDPKQIQVTVDDEPLPSDQLGGRKVDPGKHVVVAKNGAAEKREEVSVAERETKRVVFDFTSGEAAAPAPSSDTLPKILVYGGFGLAAVGIGVGAVTGLMSISKTNDLKDACPNSRCPAGRQSDIDSATTLGNISTIAFIAGGVGVAAGVVGLLMPRGDKKEPATVGFRPILSPGFSGVAGSF